jgi:hypothetical protein
MVRSSHPVKSNGTVWELRLPDSADTPWAPPCDQSLAGGLEFGGVIVRLRPPTALRPWCRLEPAFSGSHLNQSLALHLSQREPSYERRIALQESKCRWSRSRCEGAPRFSRSPTNSTMSFTVRSPAVETSHHQGVVLPSALNQNTSLSPGDHD